MNPQFQLHAMLCNLFVFLAKDSANQQPNSYIDKLFKAWSNDHKQQIYELVTRSNNHERKISVVRAFPSDRPQTPTIAITLGSSSLNPQLIGGGQHLPTTYWRNHQIRLNIFIVSDNHDEVVFLHEILEGFFIGASAQLELLDFSNLEVSAQDLQTQDNIVPTPLYLRTITLSFSRRKMTPIFAQEVQPEVVSAIFTADVVETIV